MVEVGTLLSDLLVHFVTCSYGLAIDSGDFCGTLHSALRNKNVKAAMTLSLIDYRVRDTQRKQNRMLKQSLSQQSH